MTPLGTCRAERLEAAASPAFLARCAGEGGLTAGAPAVQADGGEHASVALSKLTGEAEMTTQLTTHLQTEQIGGLSRRSLVQALAAGTAASVATPSLAEPTAVLAEATSADYLRDPTRWGSAEVAALFPGFKHIDIRT